MKKKVNKMKSTWKDIPIDRTSTPRQSPRSSQIQPKTSTPKSSIDFHLIRSKKKIKMNFPLGQSQRLSIEHFRFYSKFIRKHRQNNSSLQIWFL